MKVEIKHRWNLSVIFSAEIADDTEEKFRVRAALQIAVSSDANLRDANLRGAYLSDANLRDANLRGAYLSDANLSGADLRDANLSGADLRGAYLRDAYLSDANLRGADLRGANLRGADLSGAYLSDANLRGADLSGAYLSGADLRGAYLSGAYLSDAYLRGAYLSGAYLSDAYLRGAKTDVPAATPEQAVENLDRVREIILDNQALLEMGHWHDDNSEWQKHTCAEEAVCGTTHCLAGWLQVCSTDPKIRELDPPLAGVLLAPVASKMFFRDKSEVLEWLDKREYAA